MTKLTKEQRNVLAAVFAITNIGMPMPSLRSVRRAFENKHSHSQSPKINVENLVTELGNQYMESDEHQRIFAAEAWSWYKSFNKTTVEYVRKTWKDTEPLFDLAMNLNVPFEALVDDTHSRHF